MRKLFIFSLALFVRALLGYIFYGSIDVSAFIGINTHTFNNTLALHPFSIWCAFPVIPFYVWLCGFLSIVTQLPLAFCFKTIPILFDALLALLVYDIVQKIRPNQALLAGLLYALSPVALIITCIHGQWDAMPILFVLLAFFVRDCYQDSFKKYFLYGALFAFSFLLKPITLVFSLFLYVPWPGLKQTLGKWWTYLWVLIFAKTVLISVFFIFLKLNKSYSLDPLLVRALMLGLVGVGLFLLLMFLWYKPWREFSLTFQKYLGYQLASILGLLSMITICFLCLSFYGFNLITVIDKVLRYFNQGIAVFGLPFGYPFNQGLLNMILKNRVWIMGLIAGVAWLYYKSRLDAYQSMLVSLMIIFSFSGLSPQYLLWAVPLLLITGYYRAAALFNLVCTVFFIFYYMNPETNPEVLYQSMLSFAPLKTFSWLLPPAFLTQESLLPLIHLLGNYVIPVMCLGIAVYTIFFAHKNFLVTTGEKLSIIKNIYILFSLALTGLIAFFMLCVDQTNFAANFKATITEKMTWYDTHVINGFVSGNYNSFNFFNIITFIIMGTIIWFLVSWRASRHD